LVFARVKGDITFTDLGQIGRVTVVNPLYLAGLTTTALRGLHGIGDIDGGVNAGSEDKGEGGERREAEHRGRDRE
jgi:hypothetical protein